MTDSTPGAAAPAPAQGTIRLTIQGSELTSSLIPPTVHVSGHRVQARFGTMDVPVWAGRNRVDVHAQWVLKYGQAALDVDVPPGGVVPVFYAIPWHQFARGAIGFEPQKRPGLGGFVAGMVALVILVGLMFLAL